MNINKIKELLESVSRGNLSSEKALERLRDLPFQDLGCAKHDMHRSLRNGFSEVIYCEHKTPEDIVRITETILNTGANVFGTRVPSEAQSKLSEKWENLDFDRISRTFLIKKHEIEPERGRLAIACGGTADIPVAEEARRTAAFFGLESSKYYDVGVAGIQRVFAHIDSIRDADAVIAVAGMEGALPSVLGGLIDIPIIAVPTSVGYGSNMGGLTALFAMLNSCSEGIAVTNIDNGFGAACAALRIIRQKYSSK